MAPVISPLLVLLKETTGAITLLLLIMAQVAGAGLQQLVETDLQQRQAMAEQERLQQLAGRQLHTLVAVAVAAVQQQEEPVDLVVAGMAGHRLLQVQTVLPI